MKAPFLFKEARNHVVVAESLSNSDYTRLFSTEGQGNFVLQSGKLNIRQKKWPAGKIVQDSFRFLLEFEFFPLLAIIAGIFVLWAVLLSIGLAMVTQFDVRFALGPGATSFLDYYYFVVETMFAIGFGSPRFPACHETNMYTTVIIVSTHLLSGVVLGVIFTKFSASASLDSTIIVSKTICGTIHPYSGQPESSDSNKPPVMATKLSLEQTIPRKKTKTEVEVPNDGAFSPSRMLSFGSYGPPIVDRPPHNGSTFRLSVRIKNITSTSLGDPTISAFLLHHGRNGLTISEFSKVSADVPLEFLELPIILSVDSRDPTSPFFSVSAEDLVSEGALYELMVLIAFRDNETGRIMEHRRSWKLDNVRWGCRFRNIISRFGVEKRGVYEVDLGGFDEVDYDDPLFDDTNGSRSV